MKELQCLIDISHVATGEEGEKGRCVIERPRERGVAGDNQKTETRLGSQLEMLSLLVHRILGAGSKSNKGNKGT